MAQASQSVPALHAPHRPLRGVGILGREEAIEALHIQQRRLRPD